jgi:hypothetical protein
MPENMDALTSFADEHELMLLEDGSQAHGATWNGRVGLGPPARRHRTTATPLPGRAGDLATAPQVRPEPEVRNAQDWYGTGRRTRTECGPCVLEQTVHAPVGSVSTSPMPG